MFLIFGQQKGGPPEPLGVAPPPPLLPTGKVRAVRVLEKVKACPRSIALLLLLVDVFFS